MGEEEIGITGQVSEHSAGNAPVSCIYANAGQNRFVTSRGKSLALQSGGELAFENQMALARFGLRNLNRKFQLNP